MARQHGSQGMVEIDDPSGSPETWAEIASLNNWTLDASRDRSDVTCFGDTNKQQVQGLPNYTGTYSGIWDPDTTPSDLFSPILGEDSVGLRLFPSRLRLEHYFFGPAYLDGAIQVPADGPITISGTFSAAGNWGLIAGGSPVA